MAAARESEVVMVNDEVGWVLLGLRMLVSWNVTEDDAGSNAAILKVILFIVRS